MGYIYRGGQYLRVVVLYLRVVGVYLGVQGVYLRAGGVFTGTGHLYFVHRAMGMYLRGWV